MADPTVKHLEMRCTGRVGDEQCKYAAFVQVVIVDDPKLQKKVDAKASLKMLNHIQKEHQEGLHDGR